MSSLSAELAALGPLFQVVETLITQGSTTAEVQLCKSDPRRWALVISPPTSPAERWGVSTVTGNIALGGGRSVGVSSGAGGVGANVMELDFRKHGILAQQGFFGGIQGGATPGTGVVWTVFEILLVN